MPPKKAKTKFVNVTIGTFVDEYVLPEFDVEKVWRLQQQQKAEQRHNQRGMYFNTYNNLFQQQHINAVVEINYCTSLHLTDIWWLLYL